MKYRILGKTGLRVSVLGYGASSLGSVFRPIDETEGVRSVRVAFDMGVNFFDVSPYYGLTKAESVLGRALEGIPRDRYILSTKAGRYGTDVFDFSPERIVRSVEESLRRLRTDYVDILLLHDIEFVPFAEIAEAVPAVRRLKEQGKVRFWGVSGLPLAVFEKTLEAFDPDVILSYCHYSLNDTTLLRLLPRLEAKNVGVVNASPLSMGLLTLRGGTGLASRRRGNPASMPTGGGTLCAKRRGSGEAGRPVFDGERADSDDTRQHGRPGPYPAQHRMDGRTGRRGTVA